MVSVPYNHVHIVYMVVNLDLLLPHLDNLQIHIPFAPVYVSKVRFFCAGHV